MENDELAYQLLLLISFTKMIHSKLISKNKITNLIKSRSLSISMTILIIATIGAFIQIVGASWDITFHLMNQPETFFTPPHIMLYSGVGLLIISATVSVMILLRNKEILSKSFSSALKLLIIGSIISAVAGPSDFIWHSIFGIDGLLSPTHLTLITGMLINTIAIVLGLSRIIKFLPIYGQRRLMKALMVPAFAVLWFTMIWYIYIFALPLSKGVHFDFNLNSIYGFLIAIIVLPAINSIAFITTSKAIGKFGGSSAVTALLLAMISFTNIIPSNQLTPFLPWYLMLIIPAVVSDLIVNNHLIFRTKHTKSNNSTIFAGAIIGSMFYIMGYPMLPITFAEPLGYTFNSLGDILGNFLNTFPSAFILTAFSGIVMGIIGAIISSKKIRISDTNISNSTSSKV
jgi:hypothetical protein